MTQEEEITQLRVENQALREALSQALARIEELEKQKTPPPEFVKANVKKPAAQEKKPRKKRDAKHNHGRRRAMPTQMVEHRLVTCPDCHLRLGGISLARVREVIEVPLPPPVEITHHRIFKGWCEPCQKWHEAPLDVQGEALGQGRLGVRLISLIATLRTVMRLPVRQIRDLLQTLHGVQVSVGEIVEVLHRLADHAQPVLDDLKAQIRASPAVQADETGWREDGLNGYIWSVSTPGYALTSTIIPARGTWSNNSSASNSKGYWAAIFTPDTTAIRVCINGVGFISCAISTISKSCILMMRSCGSGPNRSSRSLNAQKPLLPLIRLCLRPKRMGNGWRSNTPSSRSCGWCVLLLSTPRLP